MRDYFDTYEYVDDLGKDLIRDFEKAGKTTHPHSVGGGREKTAMVLLLILLEMFLHNVISLFMKKIYA